MLIAFASLAMTAAFFLPVWFIFLLAPQYPEGLTMQIWLTKITGQVDIINGLNHYIGMKHISEDMFPEFDYMKYILAAFIAYGLLVTVVGSRKLLLSLLVLVLLMAGAALYDFYQWGYDYGHNLDPAAAIKVPGLSYQPPVVGHKTLLNFDAYSYPDAGGWVIIGAGAVFFLVYFLEWRRTRKAGRQNTTFKAANVATACVAFLLASCAGGPRPFAYGKDLCEDCKMTIMEPHFGAQLITTKGKVYKFDDVHCVANYINKNKIAKDDIKQTYFVDYGNETSFIEATNASFVVSPKLKSPMNSNAAAFADTESANKKATEVSGEVKTWKQLLAEN